MDTYELGFYSFPVSHNKYGSWNGKWRHGLVVIVEMRDGVLQIELF
jgi:hypothetical protein